MTPRHAARRTLGSSVLLLSLAVGCTNVPIVPVPPPLPEYIAQLNRENAEAGPGAFLGVRGSENDSGSLDDFFSDPGVRVDAVVENSPAERAGIQPGDVLLTFDARVIEDPRTLDALLRDASAGTEVLVEFRRGDAVLANAVRLAAAGGDAPAPEPLYLLENLKARAGFMTAPGGVRVVSLADDSPLLHAKITTGALLTALEGEPLLSDRQLILRLADLEAGERVTFTVLDESGGKRDARVTLFSVPTRVTKAGIPILFDYTASLDGREQAFSLLDIWIFQLLRYERNGVEKNWVLFELFGFDLISFGEGQGELE